MYFLSCSKNLTVTKSLPGSLCRPVHSARYRQCMVTVYITSGAIVSGDAGVSRPRVDHGRVNFHCELQTSWNAPESYVNLESPRVVELDTSVVPDFLSLRARLRALYDDAEPIRVLPGRARTVSEFSYRTPERSPGVSMT